MEDQLAADMHGPEEIGWLFETISRDLPEEGRVFLIQPALRRCVYCQEKEENGSLRTEPKGGRSHYKELY